MMPSDLEARVTQATVLKQGFHREFEEALLKLAALQQHIAKEHACEVAKLQGINYDLISQVSHLKAKIDELTCTPETSHLALVPGERPVGYETLEAQKHVHLVIPGADPWDEAATPPYHTVDTWEIAATPLCHQTSSQEGTNPDLQETQHFISESGNERPQVDDKAAGEKDRVPRRESCGSVDTRDSEAYSIEDSDTLQLQRIQNSQDTARGSHHMLYHKILQSRMRPAWILDETLECYVPRWSQTSGVSVSYSPSERVVMQISNAFIFKKFSSGGKSGAFSWRSTPRSMLTEQKVIHPQSRFKVTIDILGIAIMGYDFFMTPLLFFDLPETTFTRAMQWITRIFWTIEMLLCFVTATYIRGVLVTNVREIAKIYMKTFFILDVAIVLAEWLAYAFESNSSKAKTLENVYFLRVLKGMRFAKVLRVFKCQQILQEFTAQINSSMIVLLLRPLILVFFLLVLNHTNACLWYAIGRASKGWPFHELRDTSFANMYFMSLHWAVSQLHGNMDVFPHNLPERVFMCVNAIIALLLYSTFLSSITNGMMQLHSLRAERYERLHKLRSVLARRNVSVELTMKIKKRYETLTDSQAELDVETRVLDFLPADLVFDLLEESRAPVISVHNFFAMLKVRSPQVVRQLCHDAMNEASHLADEVVFGYGDVCRCMTFVTSGYLFYDLWATRGNKLRGPNMSSDKSAQSVSFSTDVNAEKVTSENVMRGSWLSEAVLWMNWEHCGRLTTRTPSLFLNVDASSFATCMMQFEIARVNSSRYARRFISRLVKEEFRSDIFPDEV